MAMARMGRGSRGRIDRSRGPSAPRELQVEEQAGLVLKEVEQLSQRSDYGYAERIRADVVGVDGR